MHKKCLAESAIEMKARTEGGEGTTPVTTACPQDQAECKTSYELSWKVKAMIVDTMSPNQHSWGKCRNPFCLPDFVSGSHARGTRDIVMSGTSPRILLLHIPPTDPLRRIYSLADSRSGTLESPAGRSFDPSVEGAMTTARPPLSFVIYPSLTPVDGLLS